MNSKYIHNLATNEPVVAVMVAGLCDCMQSLDFDIQLGMTLVDRYHNMDALVVSAIHIAIICFSF